MAKNTMSKSLATRNMTLPEKLAYYSATPNETGCVLWTAYKDACGYGKAKWRKRSYLAHRLAWIAVNGDIPIGLCVCHKCDVPACVNTDHMFLDTHAGNIADRNAKGRTAPQRGVDNSQAKLTEKHVLEIRASTSKAKEVAAAYGISHQLVYFIRSRRNWRHLV